MEVLYKEAAPSIDNSSTPLLAQEERTTGGSPLTGETAPLKHLKDSVAIPGAASTDLEVPDAIQAWQKSKRTRILWCVGSVAAIFVAACVIIQQPLTEGNTAVAVVANIPGLLAGLLSLVPPCMYFCSCWRADMAMQVHLTAWLARVAAGLDALAGLVTLVILLCVGMCGPVHKEHCSGVDGYMLLSVVCNSLSHMCLCLSIARVASNAARAMDTAASGLLPLCDA